MYKPNQVAGADKLTDSLVLGHRGDRFAQRCLLDRVTTERLFKTRRKALGR
jgi:hypothetical protein